MIRDRISNDYYHWLFDIVCGERFAEGISYNRLLTYLHNIEFTYMIPKDQNRAEDGISLRYRFAITQGYEEEVDEILDILDGPCSVFEMMIALAIRCEENIMDDPTMGDRTGQWFWGMIVNLGLGAMMDGKFQKGYVYEVIDRFLRREYEPNGEGGLFTIRRSPRDLRDVEIWIQLLWFLDSIG